MSVSEPTANIASHPQEDPSPLPNKKAVIISLLVVLVLMSGLVALFVAKTAKSLPPVDTPEISSSQMGPQTESWLAGADTTLAQEPIPTNNSSYADSYTKQATNAAEPSSAAPETTEVELAPVQAPDNAPADLTSGTVKSGVPVIKSLTAIGLSTGDAQSIINALKGVFDFRRAKPGHVFHVKLNDAGKATYFRYEAGLTDVFVVKKTASGYQGRKLNIKINRKQVNFGATIVSSLFGAFKHVGAHASLAAKIADILSTQTNFYKRQRPGDTVRAIVESKSYKGEFLGYGPILALEYTGIKSGKKRFFRFEKGNPNQAYYDSKGVSLPYSAILIPLHYTRLSSPFGMRYHPVLKRKKYHNGTDFAASSGTPVWACAPGTITIKGMHGANGNLVGIDHGEGLSSYYAHLSKFARGLKKGSKVRSKQVIGYVGNTGRSTGPHLHFGLKSNGRFIDPLKYKIRPGKRVPSKYRGELKSVISDLSNKLDRIRISPPSKPLDSVVEPKQAMGLE